MTDSKHDLASAHLDPINADFALLDERLELTPLIAEVSDHVDWNLGRVLTCPTLAVRLLLAYVMSAQSSRFVVAWACAIGLVPSYTHVSLFALLARSADFFEALARRLLERYASLEPAREPDSMPICSVDATCITSRNSGAKDFERLHLLHDLETGALRDFHLPAEQAVHESLRHFDLSSGTLVLADRLYCDTLCFEHAAKARAHLLVRWSRSRGLYHDARGTKRWDWRKELAKLEVGERAEYELWLTSKRTTKVRVLVEHAGEDFALSELDKLKANKQQINDDARLISPFMVVVTQASLEELSLSKGLESYRMRWQGSEFNIREAKSVEGLSRLNLKSHEANRAWLFCHLCGQLLTQLLMQESRIQRQDSGQETVAGITACRSASMVLKTLHTKCICLALLPMGMRLLVERVDLFLSHYMRLSSIGRRRLLSHEAYLSKLLDNFDVAFWRQSVCTT